VPNIGGSGGGDARALHSRCQEGAVSSRGEEENISGQGLTLVHFSAQRKRFLRDRGCMWGLLRGCSGTVRRYQGVIRVCFVSEMAQAELNSGRV